MDNRMAVSYVNRMGSPSLSPLCQLSLEIWNWCLARQIMIHVEYLPGSKNTIADWESRHYQDSSNWHLCPAVFDTLNRLRGPFTIDLFASRMNHQLPVYCSWRPNPGALVVDAFSTSWILFLHTLFLYNFILYTNNSNRHHKKVSKTI